MYVVVYPATPPATLTGAILACGYKPVPVSDVTDAARKAPERGWVAAVVDLGDDPGMSLAVARKLREDQAVPVLLVVDRLHTSDLVEADGFDDFILTPLDGSELAVRLERLSLSEAGEEGDPVLHYRDLELNTATYQATLDGAACDLTFMEYELLRFLVENPNRVWSREQILSKVWGYDYFGGSRTVDVHVRRLRAKLGEERSSWITTVRSVGYRFG